MACLSLSRRRTGRAGFHVSKKRPNAGKYCGEPACEKREPKPEQGDELKPRVESRSDGLYWITPKVDKDSGEIINNETWLCSPLEVVGSGSDGAERYLVLRWRSPRGHEDITGRSCADIGERDGWRSLKAGGVNVTTKSTFRAILADWLQQSGTDREWIITHTTGWHHGAYIMPDGEVIGDPETPILFNGRSAASSGYAIAGTAATGGIPSPVWPGQSVHDAGRGSGIIRAAYWPGGC